MKNTILQLFDSMPEFQDLVRVNPTVGRLRREIENNDEHFALPLLIDAFVYLAKRVNPDTPDTDSSDSDSSDPHHPDRQFLLKFMQSLLNIRQQFEDQSGGLVGPHYWKRQGNIEVLDSIIPRMREYLAEEMGILPRLPPLDAELTTHPFIEQVVPEWATGQVSPKCAECGLTKEASIHDEE